MKEKIDYSGNFRVRIPKNLHVKLVEDAKGEGTSLN
ncbi:MAG: toxin-antitoxin system HicB family antitoxin [Clostridium sp.]